MGESRLITHAVIPSARRTSLHEFALSPRSIRRCIEHAISLHNLPAGAPIAGCPSAAVLRTPSSRRDSRLQIGFQVPDEGEKKQAIPSFTHMSRRKDMRAPPSLAARQYDTGWPSRPTAAHCRFVCPMPDDREMRASVPLPATGRRHDLTGFVPSRPATVCSSAGRVYSGSRRVCRRKTRSWARAARALMLPVKVRAAHSGVALNAGQSARSVPKTL